MVFFTNVLSVHGHSRVTSFAMCLISGENDAFLAFLIVKYSQSFVPRRSRDEESVRHDRLVATGPE